MQVRVECVPTQSGEPTRFWLRGTELRVVEVRDRWLSVDHRYFKVLGADGGEYVLRHDADAGEWILRSYRGP